MRKFVIQTLILFLSSVVCGLTYNLFLKSPLPILKKYDQQLKRNIGDAKTINRESINFQEIDTLLLKQLLEGDEVVLLDARIKEEFDRGHIPSAISFPIRKFEKKYLKIKNLLSKEKIIIIYCSSKYCSDSTILAKKLYFKDHRGIFIYKESFQGWVSNGNPIDRSGLEKPNEK